MDYVEEASVSYYKVPQYRTKRGMRDILAQHKNALQQLEWSKKKRIHGLEVVSSSSLEMYKPMLYYCVLQVYNQRDSSIR